MNVTEEMLEILIGKYLDGEITPSEQQMLEEALDTNCQAKKLFEQLQVLHEHSIEVIASEILQKGRPADEIFERAWQQHAKHHLPRVIKMAKRLRFAAGLAAGLMIGVALHFTLLTQSIPQSGPVQPDAIVRNTDDDVDSLRPTLLSLPSDRTQNVTRNVDWYNFTDKAGDQWLIEGYQENVVRPAVYYRDI